jgi:hypothetical protein
MNVCKICLTEMTAKVMLTVQHNSIPAYIILIIITDKWSVSYKESLH